MMSKKIISAITASVSVAIITSISLGVYALTRNNKDDSKQTKPLNRGSDYEQINLSTKFDKSKIKDLLVTIGNDSIEGPSFNRNKFKHNIESLVRDALSKIDRFKNHVNDYQIAISYQFTSQQSIALDVVWYIQNNNPYHYYDQFQFLLKAN